MGGSGRRRHTRRAATLAIALAALALPGTATADWPVYGHDLANSRDAGDDGPSPGAIGSVPRSWTFNSPNGDFTGTPVVADGVLVAGDQQGFVYALDAVSGKLLWSRNAGDRINGSAAIDVDAPGGAAVYVPVAKVGAPHLLALSLSDGARRWDAVLTKHDGASVYGSPTYWKGTLYIGTSGPDNDDTTARGSVVALDEATGEVRWQTFTVPPGHDGAAVWSTPTIDTATGRLYVGTGNNYHEPTTDTADAILALDAATGRMLGHYQATPDDSFAADNLTSGPDHDFGASVNLFDGPQGQPLLGEGQKSGIYWALDRATMQPVWRTKVGPGGYLGGILGSTAYDGTRIYGSNALDGRIFALKPDGATAWTAFETSGAHFAPTAIAHGVLYTVDPAGFLIARDPATGEVLNRLSLEGFAFGGVSAVGGAIYAAVGTGPLFEPAPQKDFPGSIVAFGDTSRSGGRSAGTPAGPPGQRSEGIGLSVNPRRVRAQRRVVLRFLASTASAPLAGAGIRVARRVVRTDRNGRAKLRLRFARPGTYAVRATRPGFAGARATVKVIHAR